MLRIIAAGTATVLTVLLIFAGYLAVTDDNLVVPSNGVIGAPAVDDPAEGRQGLQALTERAQMQRWREVSGPSPENPEPTGVTNGAETGALGVASPDGRQLVQSWLGNRDQHAEILQDPRFVEGTSSLPGQVAGVFVQPQGRLWRSVRNSWMVYGGAIYLLGVAALLALF